MKLWLRRLANCFRCYKAPSTQPWLPIYQPNSENEDEEPELTVCPEGPCYCGRVNGSYRLSYYYHNIFLVGIVEWKPCPVHPCRHNFDAVKEQRRQAKSLKDESENVDSKNHLNGRGKAKCLCTWRAQLDEHPEFDDIEEEMPAIDPCESQWPRHFS